MKSERNNTAGAVLLLLEGKPYRFSPEPLWVMGSLSGRRQKRKEKGELVCARARGARVVWRSSSLPHPFRTPATQARSWVLGSALFITPTF